MECYSEGTLSYRTGLLNDCPSNTHPMHVGGDIWFASSKLYIANGETDASEQTKALPQNTDFKCGKLLRVDDFTTSHTEEVISTFSYRPAAFGVASDAPLQA